MRNLKLRYILELVSNIDRQAKSDAQVLAAAQQKIQAALQNTSGKFGLLERAMLRINGLSGAGIARQSQYLAKLANNALLARQRLERVGKGIAAVGRAGVNVAAAAGAAYYTTGRLIEKPMDYSNTLADMANTAFSSRDVAGRIAGKGELDGVIREALRKGGGSIEQATGSLNELLASGVLGDDELRALGAARTLLPSILQAAVAGGADSKEITQIALQALRSGHTAEQVKSLLNDALVGGQKGGFELRDQARWLPQAMAAAQKSGLVGQEGYRRVIASMQAGVTTAGSRDEAGNNVVNLLAKINSADTEKDFKKLGINLTGRLAADRQKGINALDSFIGLVDEIAARDKQFVALQQKLKNTTDKAQKDEITESMVNLLQGRAIGQVIQDRQALMALVAEMNQREYVQDVMAAMRANPGEMDTSFAVKEQEAAYKKQQKDNAVMLSSVDAFNKVAPSLNTLYDTASSLAQRFPMLSAAAVGAAGALTVLAASAAAAGAANMMTGGGTLGGLAGKLGTGGIFGKSMLGSAAGVAAAKVLAAGAVGVGIGTIINKTMVEGTPAGDKIGQMGARVMAALGSKDAQEALRINGHAPQANRSAQAWARMQNPAAARPIDPLRTVALTAPKQAPQQLASGKNTEIKLGQGKLDINVLITDQGTRVSTNVAQQLPMVQVAAGGTNPGGYGRRGGV